MVTVTADAQRGQSLWLDFIMLSEEVDLMELSVTQKIAEKTVQEINPRKMFSINLIAVKHNGSLEIEMKPDTILHRGDTVCVIGIRENIRKFERFLERITAGNPSIRKTKIRPWEIPRTDFFCLELGKQMVIVTADARHGRYL